MTCGTELAPSGLVLVADDQADVLEAVDLLLRSEGIRTQLVGSPSDVLQAVRDREFDLLLMDLNYSRDTTSGREGLDLLSQVHAIASDLPIVVMTGWATLDAAVQSMQFGVRGFLQKPWDNDRMLETVRRLIDARRAERRTATRRTRELDQAREIQRSLQPRVLPRRAGWEFAAACEEAAWLGGDTYDVFAVDDRRVAFCIADVAGKGLPAALVAANLQATVRTVAMEHPAPREVCSRLNRAMSAVLPASGRFVTFFFGLLDMETGLLRSCNAGHIPPMLMRARDTCRTLRRGGVVLGFDPEARYDEEETRLEPGDVLVLYTDGVTEACNLRDEEFGEGRLSRLVTACARGGASRMVEQVRAALADFSADRRDDDRTLLVVRRAQQPAAALR